MSTVLFLSLTCFSRSGGIETYNRNWSNALQLSTDNEKGRFLHLSLHDYEADPSYVRKNHFKGCQGKILTFLLALYQHWKPGTQLVVGHLNLSLLVWLVAWTKEKTKILVPLHGIECWKPLGYFQFWLCKHSQLLLPVSQFTHQQFIQHNPLLRYCPHRVLSNSLDPFYHPPATFRKPTYLLDYYHLPAQGPFLLTLARFSFEEQYKGYDNVIACLPQLLMYFPNLQYLLAGKADSQEQERVQGLIDAAGLTHQVHWLGWIKSNELIDHYLLADAYLMPGSKEGFGIGYIEATACGTPALGSLLDGSKEALLQGETGYLVDPSQPEDLLQKIHQMLVEPFEQKAKRQQKVLTVFSSESFMKNVQEIIFR